VGAIRWATIGMILVAGLIRGNGAAADQRALITEEFGIPAGDPGITLFIRNKHPGDLSRFSPERTVLFVHGATYPAETTFDLALDGFSWMDFIAGRGFDVYLVDVRGYGRSTRPSEMDEPAEKNPPIVGTEIAVRDVATVVDFVLARRGLPRLALIGWSWGTVIMASYTAQQPAKVERLALYAPAWIRTTPSPVQAADVLGSYRTVTREDALKRWLTGVPEDKRKELIPAGWFEQWIDATVATDPIGSKASPPVLRAPNGVVQDGRNYWAAGKPMYDPSHITAPVLLIRGDWDQDTPAYMAQAMFPLLVNAPYKRSVTIGEGTHTVMMEKNRLQLFGEVQLFLEEAGPL
jgi:pimeloyl-ACP methyl ester carboxylesterase